MSTKSQLASKRAQLPSTDKRFRAGKDPKAKPGKHTVGHLAVTLTLKGGKRVLVPGVPVVAVDPRKQKVGTVAGKGGASETVAALSQCPAIGADHGCEFLLSLSDSGVSIFHDTTEGSYAGSGSEQLWGLENDYSNHTFGGWEIDGSGGYRPLAFDGHGICHYSGGPACGSTGYEGAGTEFTSLNDAGTVGVIRAVDGPIQPGDSIYWSQQESPGPLSEPLPSQSETGGAPNLREPSCTCSTNRPVNIATGDFWHAFKDVAVPGRGPGLDLERTYDAADHATSGQFGYGWHDTYGMSLSIAQSGAVTVHQEDGSTIDFTVDPNGWYVSATRVESSLVKNADGTYTMTDFHGGATHTFSASGDLISIADRNGSTTRLSYDSAGHLSKVTDDAGRVLTVTENSAGQITKVSDPLDREHTYTYNAAGDLATSTDARGKTSSFTYDSAHRMLTMTDPRGGVVTNVYDSSGRVTSQTDALTQKTTFAYTGDPTSASGGVTTVTDPRGLKTTQTYKSLELVSSTQAAGLASAATTSYTYDPTTFEMATQTDPNDNVTSYFWDASGNMTGQLTPSGDWTSYAYDAHNDQTLEFDPMGIETDTVYDSGGNPTGVTVTGWDGSVSTSTSYTYGDPTHPGDMTSKTDPEGQTWTYTYDANGDQASVKDPAGDVSSLNRDADGEVTSSKDGRGKTTSYVYDAGGDLLSTTDPLGHKTSATYDADANKSTSTDASGNTTVYGYDLNGKPIGATRADGTKLAYSYDEDGNKTSYTNGAGKKTTYAYDSLNQLSKMTDPLNRATSYGHDADGNLTSTVNPSGQTTTYALDSESKLTSVSYSDGSTHSVAYTYDADGNRTSMTDGTGTVTYTLDGLERLTEMINGDGQAVGYALDDDGQVTSITYPDGSTVAREIDSSGRLKSVTDSAGHKTSFGYDADGQPASMSFANGVSTAISRDDDDMATRYASATSAGSIGTFGYTRNASEQISGETDSGAGGQVDQTYSVNSLGELSARNGADYSYNAADDTTAQADGSSMSFDAADEATKYTDASGHVTTLSYGPNAERATGLTPSGDAASYQYDQAAQLTKTTVTTQGGSPSSHTYSYDGDGLRASDTLAGTTRDFAWDGATGPYPLLLTDGSSDFIYGPGGVPVEQISPAGTVEYLHSDQYGSIRMITNASGAVSGTYDYSPNGLLENHSGTATSVLRWAGQFEDDDTSMYYLRARTYDPMTGQFLTPDPMQSQTQQIYGYAANDPLDRLDPSGLSWYNPTSWSKKTWETIGIAAGGVALAATGVGLLADGSLVLGEAGEILVVSGSVGGGGLATGIDGVACARSLGGKKSNGEACMGAILGAASLGFGGAAYGSGSKAVKAFLDAHGAAFGLFATAFDASAASAGESPCTGGITVRRF